MMVGLLVDTMGETQQADLFGNWENKEVKVCSEAGLQPQGKAGEVRTGIERQAYRRFGCIHPITLCYAYILNALKKICIVQ